MQGFLNIGGTKAGMIFQVNGRLVQWSQLKRAIEAVYTSTAPLAKPFVVLVGKIRYFPTSCKQNSSECLAGLGCNSDSSPLSDWPDPRLAGSSCAASCAAVAVLPNSAGHPHVRSEQQQIKRANSRRQ